MIMDFPSWGFPSPRELLLSRIIYHEPVLRAAVSFPHHVHRSERFWDSCRDDGRTQAPNGCVGWCVAGGC